MNKKIQVQNQDIHFFQGQEGDYICLTDIAKTKNAEDPRFVIQNWMKTRYTVDFLGLWETMHNPKFKGVEFDTFKAEAGTNAFVLTPKKWIESTDAIGIISRAGRQGGTFAHKDIAFEFASWISAEFKLFLIKEFQRLKEAEASQNGIIWDMRRTLTKINYRFHTDAIKNHIIPRLTPSDIQHIYASEADILNKALFGITAKDWRNKNPNKQGNLRDDASIAELLCLANLETLNAEFIRQGLSQEKRLLLLNEIAINQMESLISNKRFLN